MVKKVFLLLIVSIIFLLNGSSVYAVVVPPGFACRPTQDTCAKGATGKSYSCQSTSPGATIHLCLEDPFGGTFGTVKPPDAIKGLIGKDKTGAAAISKFLSNFVSLIYIAATIVLVFMLLWGAWDWLTSEGDKEKLSSAQKKIVNAFIGILLFAVAFALLRVLGAFTGFSFFTG